MTLLCELSIRLRGGACEALGSDLRLLVPSSGMYAYADLSVVRGEPILDDAHQDTLLNPAVIIEVLAPYRRTLDQRLKFRHYRTIDSLHDYVLVDQSEILIEHYTRQPDNTWNLRDYRRLDEELKIDSIGASIPLAAIYDRVDFSAA